MVDVKPRPVQVVVVDDQQNIRKAISRILEKKNQYIVEDFHNAQKAIEWLKNHSADLIITDLYMENGDGFELLSYVRGRAMQSDIPVLIISGEGVKEDIIRSIDLGATDYILKPFEIVDLLQKVNTIIDKFKTPNENLKKLRNAESLYLSEKYLEAKDEFEKLLENDKISARLYVNLAQTYGKLGNFLGAIEYVNKAIEVNGMYYPAYSVGADLYLENNRKLESIPFLVQELKINSKQPLRRLLLAKIYFEFINEIGFRENALEQIKLALHDSPTNEEILFQYAEFMNILGNKEKAEHYYLKARRQNPNSTRSLMSLANMYLADKKLQKAIHLFSDIINKRSGQYDIHFCRARIYEKIGELDNALSDLDKIPKTEENLRLKVYKLKVRILIKLENFSKAVLVAQELAKLESTSEHIAQVGILFMKLKDYKSALSWNEKASAQNPNSHVYLYNLGCCYEALKDKKKAELCYRKSLKMAPEVKEYINALARIKVAA